MSRVGVYFDMETAGLADSAPDIQLAAVAIDEEGEEGWREIEAFEVKIRFDEAQAEEGALASNCYNATEWALKAVEPKEAVDRFRRFLNRHRSIPMISKKTGRPYSVARLIGHNGADFDGPRLSRLFKRHDAFLPAHPQVRDTVQMALWYYDSHYVSPPENYKLATLARHLGISIDESVLHDALADARLTARVARALRKAWL